MNKDLIRFISKAWSLEILEFMNSKDTQYFRFSEFLLEFGGEINHTLLSNLLKGFQVYGIVLKSDKLGYSLTPKGISIVTDLKYLEK